MKFFFCETCGKRLTDENLARGEARDKQVRGIYCGDCAKNVLTAEFFPISDQQAQEILKQQGVQKPKAAPSAPRRGAKPLPAARGQRDKAVGSMALWALAMLIVPIALAGLYLAMRGGEKAAPERGAKTVAAPESEARPPGVAPASGKDAEEAAERAFLVLEREWNKAGGELPRQRALAEVFLASHGSSSFGSRVRQMLNEVEVPDNHSPHPGPTPPVPPPNPARAAFEQFLTQERALPPGDLPGRIALGEAFLKEHPDALESARARVMVEGWRREAQFLKEGLRPGLVAEYFEDHRFEKPLRRVVEMSVNGKWGRGGADDFGKEWGVRWTGFLRVPAKGTYTITRETEDTSHLKLGEQWLFGDEHTWVPKDPASARIELDAGLVPILIEYRKRGLAGWFKLTWDGPGSASGGPISEEYLCHRPAP